MEIGHILPLATAQSGLTGSLHSTSCLITCLMYSWDFISCHITFCFSSLSSNRVKQIDRGDKKSQQLNSKQWLPLPNKKEPFTWEQQVWTFTQTGFQIHWRNRRYSTNTAWLLFDYRYCCYREDCSCQMFHSHICLSVFKGTHTGKNLSSSCRDEVLSMLETGRIAIAREPQRKEHCA